MFYFEPHYISTVSMLIVKPNDCPKDPEVLGLPPCWVFWRFNIFFHRNKKGGKKGAMKQGRGTCSTFKAFNLMHLHIPCADMVLFPRSWPAFGCLPGCRSSNKNPYLIFFCTFLVPFLFFLFLNEKDVKMLKKMILTSFF